MPNKTARVRLGSHVFRLEEDLIGAARHHAERMGVSVAWIVRKALRDWLTRADRPDTPTIDGAD